VILLGEQESRLAIARGFGVETLQVSRDEPAVEAYLELTHGVRPDRVIECVGLPASFATALDLVRPGGDFGFVGVPHGPEAVPPSLIFDKGLRIAGGPAPARVYLPGLVGEVAAGTLDPSALMNATVPLADIAAGFEAMHTGAALKVMIRTREQSVTRTPGASIDARTER
jgi:threonine dehydrogenase-like Zn-dependent dehydrogenase